MRPFLRDPAWGKWRVRKDAEKQNGTILKPKQPAQEGGCMDLVAHAIVHFTCHMHQIWVRGGGEIIREGGGEGGVAQGHDASLQTKEVCSGA